ncbi:MAG: hypothetical protein JXA30_23185 [Deltaproteobacteria bacterium]|nr:hypothetical protein [Deltaproteobacteria bacterium]
MVETNLSIVIDRKSVRQAFKKVSEAEIVLASLAGIRPDPRWEGCLVYAGDAPEEQAGNGCIGIQGERAEEVMQRLVESLERLGLTILSIYDGGPEPTRLIARVSGGKWTSAGN